MRYTDLRARIGGISKKMLTQTLRRLSVNGLVARRASAEYCLTPLGESLLVPVQTLARWAEEHTEQLLDAQERTG